MRIRVSNHIRFLKEKFLLCLEPRIARVHNFDLAPFHVTPFTNLSSFSEKGDRYESLKKNLKKTEVI